MVADGNRFSDHSTKNLRFSTVEQAIPNPGAMGSNPTGGRQQNQVLREWIGGAKFVACYGHDEDNVETVGTVPI